ncbi:S9 family peptidase [Flavobacterium sp. UBA6135]|uniref:S9 family peptidase n=1 Tax=Flavobacterium sp. UBA6135 TaxID=1946553 RepID=UPI0025C43A46|nr:prolyl oligopeptidase family serine peptidase [Flavobacterium sp. UBA6135]
MYRELLLLIGLFGINFSPIAYAQKLPLTVEVYSQWNDFKAIAMSGDGAWVSYVLGNHTSDTLYLQKVMNNQKHIFPKCKGGMFSSDTSFFVFLRNDSLQLFDLKKVELHLIGDSVLTYHFSKYGKQLVVVSNSGSNNQLTVLKLNTLERKVMSAVTEFSFSKDKRFIIAVVTTEKSQKIMLYDLETNEEQVVAVFPNSSVLTDFTWDDKGQQFAFFLEDTKNLSLHLYYYYINTIKGKKSNLQVLPISRFPKNFILNRQSLYLTNEGSKVFFSLESLPSKSQNICESCVQVWHSDSVDLPSVKKNTQVNKHLYWHYWDVRTQQVGSVEDSNYEDAILNGNAEYALLVEKKRFDLGFKKNTSNDLYLKHLERQEYFALDPIRKSFPNTLMFSPKGNFIAYYIQKQWWIYTIQTQLHTCVTCLISTNFHNEQYDKPGGFPPAAPAWWASDDSSLFLSDTHDVWQFTTGETLSKRITKGKEEGKVYRIYESPLRTPPKASYYGFQTRVVPVKSQQLLYVKDLSTLGTGFALMNSDLQVTSVLERESTLHLIQASDAFDAFLFVEQHFSLPPRLLFVNEIGNVTEIAQTNKQQAKYEWGKSKLIQYNSPNISKELKGALFYPESYDEKKEYPLLVVIYERKSSEIMEYVSPTDKSTWGFNLSTYVSDGYFVLYPDIVYGVDSPGADALACVKAAVTLVLKEYSISKNRIALMGHSFGGYETAYIMGNTNLFRTAVIGSPMIDLTSAYLTSDGHGKSNMWRFERDQMRITAPFYSERFLANSPLQYVPSITSPILTWTGTKDLQLDWLHSVKFHNALWRLDKLSTLLVYPDEGHVLMQESNQLDLTKRVKDWFDHYLKDKSKTSWMM